jgi:putative aldouronate transport system permease protein
VKGSLLKAISNNLMLYLMVAPGLLYFIVYKYFPMYGVIIAFKDFRLARGILNSPWIGFEHFQTFFSSPFFGMVLTNTILISLYKLLFEFSAPILLALCLNEVRIHFFKRTLQTVLYLPHFISWIIIGNIAIIFLGSNTGVITEIVRNLTGYELNLLMDSRMFRGVLVVSEIWKNAGWSSIIYLAAIAGIDSSLYEAAVMDGAKKIHQIVYITIPSLMPIIVIMFLLRLGHILDAGFEQIFIMQNPLVYDVSEVIDTFVYKTAFTQGQYGLAAAVNLFKSIVGLVLVVGANHLAKKLGGQGLY